MTGHRPDYRRMRSAAAAVGWLCLSAASGFGQSHAPDRPDVLLLNSYHHGYIWSDRIVEGVRDELPPNANAHMEYMDAKRHFSPAYFEQFRQMLAAKYPPGHFEAIVCNDDTAFDFLRQHHEALFPGTPVVFCGVGGLDEPAIEADPLYTGIHERVHLADTLTLALALHPQARRIVVISDQTRTSRGLRQRLEKLEAESAFNVPMTFLDTGGGMTVDELTEAVGSTPADSVVFYVGFYVERTGRVIDYQSVLRRLSRACPAPIYSHADIYLDCGIVGGRLKSAYYLGHATGRLARLVLSGRSPRDIPIQHGGASRYMFDHEQLVRWGLSRRDLPTGSIIVNEPDSFYYRHRTAIVLIMLLSIGQTAIIVGLVWNIARCRRSEQARRASEATLGSIFRAAPAGMGLTVNRLLKRVNDRMCEMTGYRRDELVGQDARMLYPSDEEYEFVGREKYRQIDASGVGTVETHWRRRDGTVIDVLLSSARIDSRDPAVGVTFTAFDISDRKHTERALRDRHAELQSVFAAVPEAVIYVDTDRRVQYVNPAFTKIFGYAPEEMLGQSGRLIYVSDEAFEEQGRLHYNTDTCEVFEPYEIDYRRKGGCVFPAETRGTPVRDGDGRPIGFVALVRDITDRKHAEAEIRRLARFPAENPSPVLRVDREGSVYYANDPAVWLLNQLRGGPEHGVPDDWRTTIARALDEGASQQIDVSSDGRTFTLTLAPIADSGYVNIYGMDITDRLEAEKRQQLIMRELDHRVKNNLAAVQSLAEQSLMRAGSMRQFRDAFIGRLQAMARTHEALAQARWRDVDLREAALLVLGPYLQSGVERLELEGEHLRLPARAALPIGLTLHELATNAMKYGALSVAHGRVSVSWRKQPDDGIELHWREHDGPPVTPPDAEGTGSTLIRGLVGYELQGSIELDYSPQGVMCRIVIPPEGFRRRPRTADTHSSQPQPSEDARQ